MKIVLTENERINWRVDVKICSSLFGLVEEVCCPLFKQRHIHSKIKGTTESLKTTAKRALHSNSECAFNYSHLRRSAGGVAAV